VYCQSGRRSVQAVEQLQTQYGFTNLLNLEGGILAWNEEEKLANMQGVGK
jgi:adenylyltransferase/sulfurtransferase